MSNNNIFVNCTFKAGFNMFTGNYIVKFPKPLATPDDFYEMRESLKKEIEKDRPEKKITDVIISNWRRLEFPE